MNEKNNCWAATGTLNVSGYSGTIGVTTTTNTNVIGTTNINSGLTTLGNSSNFSLSTGIANSNNMNRQVKVAVFTVERNDKGTVTSSKFVKELWIEQRNGASIELAVAKQLDKDFDPANIIIREISSINL